MILYTLGCDNGHRFESWFADSAAFDDQAGRGYVTCPVCGSSSVAKAIMAPALVSSRPARPDAARMPVAANSDAMPAEARGDVPRDALFGERERMMRGFLRAMRDKILTEGRDVGSAFPDEARRMHDGAIPVRPIHGRATPAEARELLEDGIMIMPIPALPEELN